MVLRLQWSVYPCAEEKVFRVSYTVPSTGRLQPTGGWSAAGWAADKWAATTPNDDSDDYSLVTNARHARCAEWLAGMWIGTRRPGRRWPTSARRRPGR